MAELIRSMPWTGAEAELDPLITREWLVTNGLGGYASATVSGAITRRYHGLLIAALPAPFGRTVMFNHLAEQIHLPDGTVAQIGGEERGGRELAIPGARYLAEFRLEMGLPVWRYRFQDVVLEKRVLLVYRQNTVHVTYRLVSGEGPVRLDLRPSLHFRSHDGVLGEPFDEPYAVNVVGNRCEVIASPASGASSERPPLRLLPVGERATLTLEGGTVRDLFYRVEADRGYDSLGEVWSPGYFSLDVLPERGATLVASTEPWDSILALAPEEAAGAEARRREQLIAIACPEAQTGAAAELVLAADQFIITPVGRAEDAARVRALGEELRTVIAGYHWFTDWGRDTMISLEGLTLTTGRYAEAGWILRTFAHYVRDGLIPNLFPEGENQGLYHTADATLWFFHALGRYLETTGDRPTLRLILPKLLDIVEHHVRGTRYGMGVDPEDGLLREGEEGYQLTWMDAKMGDWVVTPRRGKAVEINALWYNALRLLEGWVREESGDADADRLAELAQKTYESFNRRFWYEEGGYLYDVVDGEQGDDPACRPNQILTVALQYPILDPAHWEAVVEVVRERLLTPVGLRSLAPGHPDYKPQYWGDLRARDAAYHQGTVWAWLIGPFVDAWLKVHPDDRTSARRFLEGFVPHLDEAGMGSLSEIYDAEWPFTPRGCIAQAWSVAEVLRCWVKTSTEPCNT